MLLYTTYHTVYRSYVDNIVFVSFQRKSVTTHDPVARCRQRHCNEWNWLEMVKNIHGDRPFYSTRFWLYTHTWILLSGASMRHVASLKSQRGGASRLLGEGTPPIYYRSSSTVCCTQGHSENEQVVKKRHKSTSDVTYITPQT